MGTQAEPGCQNSTMNPSPANIGLLIRQTRRQQGLKQKNLASFAAVRVRFLHELEHGKSGAELARPQCR